jgi:hypothetical protein
MKLSATKRVANGARWLDENFPRWEQLVDPHTLEMESGSDCICGQVFKEKAESQGEDGYNYAVDTLFSEVPDTLAGYKQAEMVSDLLGFSADNDDGDTKQWELLQRLWKRELKRRPRTGALA